MRNEAKNMMRTYYTTENFPELVAHSHGWDIYAKREKGEIGNVHCAAIPTTLDRLPHGYGTIDYVAKQIKLGYLRPAIGNLHLATA